MIAIEPVMIRTGQNMMNATSGIEPEPERGQTTRENAGE